MESGIEDGAQTIALLSEHSLWITQQFERGFVAGKLSGGTHIVKLLREEKQVPPQQALQVVTAYYTVRQMHFARRRKMKLHLPHLEMIAAWTPPDWVYNCFPLPDGDMETVTLDYIVDAMHEEIDRCTEQDSTPLGRVLHVAHMLVCFQGDDGFWAAMLNLRTGEDATPKRSPAPRNLMRRLNQILASSEFDFAIRRIEAGMNAQKTE